MKIRNLVTAPPDLYAFFIADTGTDLRPPERVIALGVRRDEEDDGLVCDQVVTFVSRGRFGIVACEESDLWVGCCIGTDPSPDVLEDAPRVAELRDEAKQRRAEAKAKRAAEKAAKAATGVA